MIVVGYRLWWIRRPARAAANPANTLIQAWFGLAWPARLLTAVIAVLLGVALPLMGAASRYVSPLIICAGAQQRRC